MSPIVEAGSWNLGVSFGSWGGPWRHTPDTVTVLFTPYTLRTEYAEEFPKLAWPSSRETPVCRLSRNSLFLTALQHAANKQRDGVANLKAVYMVIR